MSVLKFRDAETGQITEILAIKGETGKSAYEYAKAGGFAGTEEEFLILINKAVEAADTLPTPTIADAGKFLRVDSTGNFSLETLLDVSEVGL